MAKKNIYYIIKDENGYDPDPEFSQPNTHLAHSQWVIASNIRKDSGVIGGIWVYKNFGKANSKRIQLGKGEVYITEIGNILFETPVMVKTNKVKLLDRNNGPWAANHYKPAQDKLDPRTTN